MSDEQTTQDVTNGTAPSEPITDDKPAPGSGQPPESKPNEQLFTQADLDRIVAKKARALAKSNQSEFFQSMGVDSAESLKSIVEAQKQAEDKQKTDLERLNEQAHGFQKQAETLQAQLAKERQDRLIERVAHNLKFADVTDALALVDRSDFDADLTIDIVSESLGNLLEKKPHLAIGNVLTEPKEPEKPKAPDIKPSTQTDTSATAEQRIEQAASKYLPSLLTKRRT